MAKVKLMLDYFKESGKWYADGSCEVDHKPLFEIWDEVRAMNPHPGLSGAWSGPYILVNSDHEHAHPRLLINGANFSEGV